MSNSLDSKGEACMTETKTPEVLPLTSLRFFLASWIVLFHLDVTIPRIVKTQASGASKALNTLFCAYVAVSIFFVLSGFILALNYRLDQPWDAARRWRFAVARFSRIYPVYLLALILISPIIGRRALQEHSLRRHGASGILNIFS